MRGWMRGRRPRRSACRSGRRVRVPRGHALRLSVAGACVPAYALNLGTGALADAARLVDAGIITLTVRSGGHAPSRVLIPERTAIGPSAAR